MINFFKKILAKMNKWIYGPCYTCCRDKDKKQEKEAEQQPGGFAY
jgi:hypothetical protein